MEKVLQWQADFLSSKIHRHLGVVVYYDNGQRLSSLVNITQKILVVFNENFFGQDTQFGLLDIYIFAFLMHLSVSKLVISPWALSYIVRCISISISWLTIVRNSKLGQLVRKLTCSKFSKKIPIWTLGTENDVELETSSGPISASRLEEVLSSQILICNKQYLQISKFD